MTRGPKPGSGKTGGAAVGALGGRPPTRAIIREGDGIFVSEVHQDGGYVDLGRGKAQIVAKGRDRIVVVPLSNGSEIRILIPR